MIRRIMLIFFAVACAVLFSCGSFSPGQKAQMANTAATVIRAGVTLAQLVEIMGAPDSAQTIQFRDAAQPKTIVLNARSHWIYKNVVFGVQDNKVIFIIDRKAGKKIKTYSPG